MMRTPGSGDQPAGVRRRISLPSGRGDTFSTRVRGSGARSNQEVAADARAAVVRQIERRGGSAKQVTVGQRTELHLASASGRLELRVSSKRTGDWQSSIREGEPTSGDDRRFWLFVDLAQREPRYYVVPESKAVDGIRTRHQEYLARNGGRRVVNNESVHCAIRVRDIAEWADRWDLLGLEPA